MLLIPIPLGWILPGISLGLSATFNCSVDPFIDYHNCTGSNIIPNFTSNCCQPDEVKNIRTYVLVYLSFLSFVGFTVNIYSVITLTYIIVGQNRFQVFGFVSQDLILKMGVK